ncbi:MAG TPA: hypothetical protein DCE26_07465 [Dehalococcoidia bacterium]|nr:DUF1326 domain-containing protein [SAR202 cluster bacterium]HAA95513.1 hypothetical protein [Dehalococcoidia bacterium]|tara:strand:- start:2484 stop:3101 length:618 start_codon:yes stop_codon:yes gene_type:complete
MAENWSAEGDLFEGCNCNLLCPCHVSFRQPTNHGFCDAVWAVKLQTGRYGDVDLAGLGVAIFVHCPGQSMADGDWTPVMYLDDRANADQEEALRMIFSGEAGGPWQILSQFYRDGKYLAVTRTPLDLVIDERTKTVNAPDRLFMEFQALRGADQEGVVTLNNLRNVIHGPEHVLGRSNINVNDEGMDWDYQAKHGLYSWFKWAGS